MYSLYVSLHVPVSILYLTMATSADGSGGGGRSFILTLSDSLSLCAFNRCYQGSSQMIVSLDITFCPISGIGARCYIPHLSETHSVFLTLLYYIQQKSGFLVPFITPT